MVHSLAEWAKIQTMSKHRNVDGVGINVCQPWWRGSYGTTSTAASIGTSVWLWADQFNIVCWVCVVWMDRVFVLLYGVATWAGRQQT